VTVGGGRPARASAIARLAVWPPGGDHAIADWDLPPVHVSLFGSVARGEGDATSDIDLFVVRPDDIAEDDARWRGQIDGLAAQVVRWTGNHAGIAEAANAETKRPRKDRPPIVAELDAYAIVLSGNALGSLLGAGAMSPAAKGRTRLCSEPQARTRLDHARRFLDVAQLTADEDDAKEYSSAAAALAVLAGIAASDAACCKALGRRARGQDHRTSCRSRRSDRARRRSSGQFASATSACLSRNSPIVSAAIQTFAEDRPLAATASHQGCLNEQP
jgi:hypothetical protein